MSIGKLSVSKENTAVIEVPFKPKLDTEIVRPPGTAVIEVPFKPKLDTEMKGKPSYLVTAEASKGTDYHI